MVIAITVNYNLSEETIPCVNSVLDSDYSDLVVYVVDNGSEPADYQRLSESFAGNRRVRILRIEKNTGYVGGVNHGIRFALEQNPGYCLVMNNDTVIARDAVTHLVNAAMRHDNKAVITGKVYYFSNPDILQHTGEIITDSRFNYAISPGRNEKDTGQFDMETERDALDDVFWLLPAGLVRDVGLYCDYFFLYAEQADYSLRARAKGYRLIFTPGARIWHKVSMTSGGGDSLALPVSYWRGQGLFLMHFRHLRRVNHFIASARWLSILAVKALLRRGEERKRAVAQIRGYLWGIRWMIRKRPNDGSNPYLTPKRKSKYKL